MMEELRLKWIEEILKRIEEVMNNHQYDDYDKLQAVRLLLKQAKNINREE